VLVVEEDRDVRELVGISLRRAGLRPVLADGAGAAARAVDGAPTPSALIHGAAFFGTLLPLPSAYAFAALRLADEAAGRRFAGYTAALPSAVVFLLVVFGVLGSDPGAPPRPTPAAVRAPAPGWAGAPCPQS
jgi:hypothetical protein